MPLLRHHQVNSDEEAEDLQDAVLEPDSSWGRQDWHVMGPLSSS